MIAIKKLTRNLLFRWSCSSSKETRISLKKSSVLFADSIAFTLKAMSKSWKEMTITTPDRALFEEE